LTQGGDCSGNNQEDKRLEEVTLNSTTSRLGGRSRGTVTRAGHSHACTTDIPSCIADAFIVGTQEKSLAREEDNLPRQSPSLIFFDVLALHATHWEHLSKIRRKGNEVRSGADTWDECSSVYSCATASVVHADGETRSASHIPRQCATCSSESDKHQVRGRVCSPLIRRKCRAVETESAHSSFR
jgi:hypothetical protein